MANKDKLEGNKSADNVVAEDSPPKPFIKPHTGTKTAAFRPALRDPANKIPGGGLRRSENRMSTTSEANKLTVGKNISLNGEIVACEKLIVEGQVEATLRDAHIIEVLHGGCFKGSADVEEASISGEFKGKLVVKDLLTIHKNGHVEGSIRYGRIIIEAGGIITGDMASLEDQ